LAASTEHVPFPVEIKIADPYDKVLSIRILKGGSAMKKYNRKMKINQELFQRIKIIP